MQNIDPRKLETDPEYRLQYLLDFVDFTERDAELIRATAPVLTPLEPVLVGAVYDKIFTYDVTTNFVMPKDGSGDLSARKHALKGYLLNLLKIDIHKGGLAKFLSNVGRVHTHIPLVHMNAMMGFVSTAILAVVADHPEITYRGATVKAFNKLFWVQADFITTHYEKPQATGDLGIRLQI
jgi:hemoglobin-like flavoprotein